MRGLRIRTGVIVVSLLFVSQAWAGDNDFAARNGIYLANVACRVDFSGNFVTSISDVTYSDGVTGTGNAGCIIDGVGGAAASWAVTGLSKADTSASVVVNLGQVWEISQIWMWYQRHDNYQGISYKLEVSTNGTSWDTVVQPKPVNAATSYEFTEIRDVFTAVPAQYIRLTAFGAEGAANALRLIELSAYVSASASNAPQKDGGFNVARQLTRSSLNLSNWVNDIGWHPAEGLFDGLYGPDGGLYAPGAGSWATIGTQSVVLDLGERMLLNRVAMGMQNGWADASVAFGETANGPWYYLLADGSLSTTKPSGQVMMSSTMAFSPTWAQYVLISCDYSVNDKLKEFQVFAVAPIPEPATMTLLALGGLALLRRRK